MRNISILKDNGFDVDNVFEMFGDIKLYEEILTDFYNQAKERGLKLIECVKNNDMKNYSIIVHSIKGDSLYLGIKDFADMSYEHQLKAEENDIEFIKNNFEKYTNEFTKVLNTIKSYFKETK